jgi:predicted PurR-regulated permease PerM
MSLLSPQDELRSLRWATLLLAACAIVTLLPFWAPLALAAWLAILTRPIFLRTAQHLGGRARAAGAILVTLGMGLLVPLFLAVVSLIRGAVDLGDRLLKSQGAKDALMALAGGGGGGGGAGAGASSLPHTPEQIINLIKEHGAKAVELVGGIAGAAASAIVAFVIFFYAAYVFLIDGPELYAWVERHAPFNENVSRRFAAAFEETGRGLLLGVALTALAQAFICTIVYFALGVPRAFVLGFLTFLAALLPAGTALVWIPVAAGLFLSGRTKEAIILTVIATTIVGTIDNILRPIFARRGHLQLSTFILLLAMLGGFAVFGGWGLVLGPLAIRLSKEALAMIQEARMGGGTPSIPPPPPFASTSQPPFAGPSQPPRG